MPVTFALITDLHFGPEARFAGKLRKLTHHAERLSTAIAARLRDELRPDFLVNLGDDIEDEDRERDLERYRACQAILRSADCELINVAGNHDVVHLGQDDLNRMWGRSGPLYYSFDYGEFHFVVLHTLEKKDIDVSIPAAQLRFLEEDLQQTARPTIVFMHHSASEQDLRDSRWFSRRPDLALVRERKRLRDILEASGKVRAVFNGHVHRNHLDVIGGIPYVTLQSLIENIEDDAPGTPAASFAIVNATLDRIDVRVEGNDRANYTFMNDSRLEVAK